MRIAGAESTEDDLASICAKVSVGVREVKQFGGAADIKPAVAMLQPCWDKKAVREDSALVSAAIAFGVLKHDDFVIGLFAGLELRIDRAACDPEPAFRIEAHLNWLGDPVGFGGEEIC